MFHRIDFWTVGRLRNQPNILWHHEVLRLMPARLIHLHHDEILLERLTDMHEKELHHRRRGPRQHQGRHLPLGGRHSGIDIGIFPDHLARRTGPNPRGRPAPPLNADPTETGLIFRHLQDGALVLWSTGGNCRLDQSLEVFLNAACSAGSALGWTGRGTSLRHPCRSSSRRMVLSSTSVPTRASNACLTWAAVAMVPARAWSKKGERRSCSGSSVKY